MATEYTITYTFTGQSNTSASRSVGFDRFEAKGDTDRVIERITSIQYVHYHTSTGGAYWNLRGRLVFGDGTTLESDFVNHRIERGNVVGYTNTFAELPTKEQFGNLLAVQTLDTKGKTTVGGYEDKLRWQADSTYPMKLIVKFIGDPPVVYAPKIEKFDVYRCNSSGGKDDEGKYVRTHLKLSIADSAGFSGAQCRIYYKADGYPEVGKDQYVDVLSKVTTSQLLNGVIIDPAGAWNLGNAWNFALVFTAGNETAIATASVARGTTSLHISGDPGGGAAIGGFSTGTTSKPKFESYAPAYFYGGIDGITNYSTDEVETPYKWIDGRKIYRRIIAVKASANTTTTLFTFSSAVEVLNIFGYIIRAGGDYRFPPCWYAGGGNYHIVWMETTTKLVAQSTAALTGHLILEYVK